MIRNAIKGDKILNNVISETVGLLITVLGDMETISSL
jgi:hypothetical protein